MSRSSPLPAGYEFLASLVARTTNPYRAASIDSPPGDPDPIDAPYGLEVTEDIAAPSPGPVEPPRPPPLAARPAPVSTPATDAVVAATDGRPPGPAVPLPQSPAMTAAAPPASEGRVMRFATSAPLPALASPVALAVPGTPTLPAAPLRSPSPVPATTRNDAVIPPVSSRSHTPVDGEEPVARAEPRRDAPADLPRGPLAPPRHPASPATPAPAHTRRTSSAAPATPATRPEKAPEPGPTRRTQAQAAAAGPRGEPRRATSTASVTTAVASPPVVLPPQAPMVRAPALDLNPGVTAEGAPMGGRVWSPASVDDFGDYLPLRTYAAWSLR